MGNVSETYRRFRPDEIQYVEHWSGTYAALLILLFWVAGDLRSAKSRAGFHAPGAMVVVCEQRGNLLTVEAKT
jgi:hypothetical protein